VADEGVSGRIRSFAMGVGLSALVACGGAASQVQVAGGPSAVPGAQGAAEFPTEDRALLQFRSARFRLTIPLPDGRRWLIDDHKHPELVAAHPPTQSALVVSLTLEHELVNRQRCEERAREQGLVPSATLRTVEDQVIVGPEAFDSRVWVALEAPATAGGPLTGHVLGFGAYIHKCLFFHFASKVPSDRDEAVLSSRLATARLKIWDHLGVEPFDEPPRESPR
jgi:hypothetical protein